jgi:CDP-diacylglycerol--serine O-phosphatidyltransferase
MEMIGKYLAKPANFVFLPDAVTMLNLFCGFLSILMAVHGRIEAAVWLILMGLVCDSLDGNIARIFKNPTKFGKELDSLADMVSFVAAPAVLIGSLMVKSSDAWTLSFFFFYLSAGAFRLARFNVGLSRKTYFQGLPTPAAALALSMTMLAFHKDRLIEGAFFLPVIIALVMAASFLMVSEIKYPKLSAFPFKKWQTLLYTGIGFFVVLLINFNAESAFAGVFLVYLFISPLYGRSISESDEGNAEISVEHSR